MIFTRSDSHASLTQELRASYTTLPERRMSTQSLICETSSMYPSVHRRQGSLCALDKLSYAPCPSQLSDVRLPPPSHNVNRRRRMSATSSQGSRAAHAGSDHEYLSGRGSRCRSSVGPHYGLEPELWLPRGGGSLSHSDLLQEVSMSPNSTNTRHRVWSETGRSCGETTIRASVRQFRCASDYYTSGSRQPSSRRLTSEDPNYTDREDAFDSFTDSLMPSTSTPNYERLHSSRKDKKRRSSRNQRGYHCYDNPASLENDGSGS